MFDEIQEKGISGPKFHRISLSFKDCQFNLLISRKNENGNIEAGTHLIFIDNSTCDSKSAEQLTDPKILNYYRQFLIKGIDGRYFIRYISQATLSRL